MTKEIKEGKITSIKTDGTVMFEDSSEVHAKSNITKSLFDVFGNPSGKTIRYGLTGYGTMKYFEPVEEED